jgi:tRNA threonylcarbamoyladenosine biosynthesis protein TsaE
MTHSHSTPTAAGPDAPDPDAPGLAAGPDAAGPDAPGPVTPGAAGPGGRPDTDHLDGLGVPLDTEVELPAAGDTEELGVRLAQGLGRGDLVVLAGPLGAGKTVLVRGLARGLGVAGPITSPTFVIAREHRPLPGGAGVPLVHVDAYRLGSTGGDVAAELDDLDLDTDLADAVLAVEWGEGVAERLAARHLLVRLDRRPDDVRVATVHRVDPI